ncbi:TIM barrel protein [Methermicoccus shengliensis]|uniref:TIM barrel protein n=1 Tax=Methermicoccus shengliensis TaxID=660064 RepID=A0A832RX21_9EURY|nr:TIM barrel protein [Methermicoccus shengliensis]KUK04415.1 MAG: Endonuclease IV [Euryarchaeota archaeon 55_53]KUK30578.1 MAG: Endonuclease IV [Methanosarcinales archeaon 56_1174]MDI3488105.1 deoxyribonuclease [Methanosarcinales archaeon]MDN5295696.1 deoxyribonuclease [Methanosarcinales archaeon]HIH70170.1 TIM barrel protein [Methermicoccus shengliensis]
MDRVLFGTAGIPLRVKKRDTELGIAEVAHLGLDALEMEFVRGVKMGEHKAEAVRRAAERHGVVLTAHAPYYINLNSKEDDKQRASIERIVATARIAHLCGGYSIVFHPAYYHGDPPEVVYDVVKRCIIEVLEELGAERGEVWIRPETMGRPTQFGTLDEVLSLSAELDGVLPCIDFSHMHAREGKMNTYEEFAHVLEQVEQVLGAEALKEMHCHVQGIEYTNKGEKNHLNLRESDFDYRALLSAFIDYDIAGVVICESPNIEEDALLLKHTYEELKA